MDIVSASGSGPSPPMRNNRDVAAKISIRLQPRAKRDEIAGQRNGALLVRVKARPIENRANDALRRVIASKAGIPKRQVTIVSGHKTRDKLVRVEGLAPLELRRALEDGAAGA